MAKTQPSAFSTISVSRRATSSAIRWGGIVAQYLRLFVTRGGHFDERESRTGCPARNTERAIEPPRGSQTYRGGNLGGAHAGVFAGRDGDPNIITPKLAGPRHGRQHRDSPVRVSRL